MNTKKERFSIEAKFPIDASEQFIREQFMIACDEYIKKTAWARLQKEKQTLLDFISNQNKETKDKQ